VSGKRGGRNGTAAVRATVQSARQLSGRRLGRDGSARGEAAVGERRARGGRGTGGRGEATVGRRRGVRGAVGTRGPDSGLKPRCRRGTWRPRGSGALPHGPGAVRDG
jgi:hypothetical protein